jgi:2-keto-4-pentenoate hydratase
MNGRTAVTTTTSHVTELHQQAAEHLLSGYRTGVPVAPVVEAFPELTFADAYVVQQVQVAGWIADGDRVRGHKVGLSSQVMQRQAGVDQPDYGHLTQSMFFSEHEPIPASRFLQPRVEPEVAFVLSRPLCGPGVTAADAIAAIDFVLPALEIVDSRIAQWRIGIIDTISDNASSGGVVLGSTPVSPRSVDLRLTGCVLHRNGAVVATGAGGAVLGSPVASLVWLANTLGALGVTLEAGHVVLPGSMTATQNLVPGDVVSTMIGGIGTATALFGAEQQ